MGYGGLSSLRVEGGNYLTNPRFRLVLKGSLRVESSSIWFMEAEVVYE